MLGGVSVSKFDAILAAVLDAITDDGDLDGSVKKAAALFCGMSDDGQARFFSEVAAIMKTWGSAKSESQAHYIGRHLRNCECATVAGRDLVRSICDAMKHPETDA